jgi:hypothetical protein
MWSARSACGSPDGEATDEIRRESGFGRTRSVRITMSQGLRVPIGVLQPHGERVDLYGPLTKNTISPFGGCAWKWAKSSAAVPRW